LHDRCKNSVRSSRTIGQRLYFLKSLLWW
jgi:hypothetical protein